jgi:hypothetical protein
MQHAHMQLALQRVLHLQTLKSPQLQHPVLSSLNHAELAAVLGLPDPQHTFALTPLGTSIPTSSSDAGSSTAASSSKGASSWSAWSVTLAGAAAVLASGVAHWGKFVLGMQQELLSAIEALGTDALALHATYQHSSSQSSATAPAGSGTGESTSTTADAVRTLLQKLPDVWESVQQDAAAAEMAGVLQALFNAEFRAYGSVSSFMRGHLHQCPNGHFFVIGECGGAMQESRCVECGAVVGGSSHQLASGSQQASSTVLEQLQEQWGGGGRG